MLTLQSLPKNAGTFLLPLWEDRTRQCYFDNIYMPKTTTSFFATIGIIGINPFVFVPDKILKILFEQAGKDKGKIAVKMTIDGHSFTQTLVKYAGHWRLYLNMPMRKAAGKEVGDKARFELEYNPVKQTVAVPPALQEALDKDTKAAKAFSALSPSRQLEIKRYINNLKTEESIKKNVTKVLGFLNGNDRFAGRQL
jgi:hypothetical protein